MSQDRHGAQRFRCRSKPLQRRSPKSRLVEISILRPMEVGCNQHHIDHSRHDHSRHEYRCIDQQAPLKRIKATAYTQNTAARPAQQHENQCSSTMQNTASRLNLCHTGRRCCVLSRMDRFIRHFGNMQSGRTVKSTFGEHWYWLHETRYKRDLSKVTGTLPAYAGKKIASPDSTAPLSRDHMLCTCLFVAGRHQTVLYTLTYDRRVESPRTRDAAFS